MVRLIDIVDVLRRYRERYRWLDVRVDDVPELHTDAGVEFRPVGGTAFRTRVDGQELQVVLPPGRGVARFELAPGQGTTAGGAIVGAGLGGALGAAIADSEPGGSAPVGAVFGLLVGGLLGAAAGAAATAARTPPQRVLTLRYDDGDGEWRVYHGPYVSWAKGALRAS